MSKITAQQWEQRMDAIPEGFKARCTTQPGAVRYLKSPYEYACRGDDMLHRLRYDDSLAALRLWAFIFSEKDRLFAARDHGWRIFAAMKDLGSVPVISYAVPRSLTFYADELWWAPCFAERPHLLEVAARYGAGEELCYVRAALGAMVTLEYFPRPDLCIAGVGACCDDFSAVMQLIEAIGMPVHWWEMPVRHERSALMRTGQFMRTRIGRTAYLESARRFAAGQLAGIRARLEDIAGLRITERMLDASRTRFNAIRARVYALRELVYSAERPPLPGLEMMLAEFIAIHACSDPDESVAVLDGLLDIARARLSLDSSPFGPRPVRVFWATPSTDATLVQLLEDLGGAITGTEYMISHAFYELATDVSVIDAVAESSMDDPMTGSARMRARRIVAEARRFGAEGVIISGISGASHCAFDEAAISHMVREELGLPVLSFDVPFSPGRINQQVQTKMEAFMEVLKDRRMTTAGA